MTAYEIISIFIGILALLMSFGSLIVALLAFLDKEKRSSGYRTKRVDGLIPFNKRSVIIM